MIEATYFDGRTSRRHPVTVVIHKRVLAMRGEGLRRMERLSKLDISERLQHAPRILRFRDGAFLEVGDARLNQMLEANRYREPRVVRWQNNWPLSLLALIALLALLIGGYQWGMPWAADRVAQHLPASLEKRIGDEQLKLIDARFFAPSKLPAEHQARLQRQFSEMKQPRSERTAYRLEFRDSRIGPNAFALPNGTIVMTDQLVQMAGDDRAVLGVLGHELGHLQRRHSLRRLLQALGVGIVLNLWVGDVSSVLAAVPTFLLDQKYSRDFEREADRYAIDMMRVNGLALEPMAALFEKMGKGHEDAADTHAGTSVEDDDEDAHGGTEAPEPPRKDNRKRKAAPDYFSSHPSDEERIARLRAADKQQ